MKLLKPPSLASRAISTLVKDWGVFRDGDFLSANLSLAGFDTISYGNFSSVIDGRPGQVIKIFNLNDIGYQMLIDLATTNSTTHLPEIVSYITSGHYGIVEMEKLNHNTKEAVAISNYIDRLTSGSRVKHRWGDGFKEVIEMINSKITDHNLSSKENDITWDVHEQNIMFKDNIPVLSDVLFGEA